MLFPAKKVSGFVWSTLEDFVEHECPTRAAALAFYTFFSLPALLLVLLTMLGLLADPQEVQRQLVVQLGQVVGPAGAEQVVAIIDYLTAEETRPAGVTILGLLALLFGATAAFAALQGALNHIWSVAPDPQRGTLRNFLVKRLFSFGIVLVVGFLLLVSLLLSTALVAMGERVAAMLPGWTAPLLWLVNTGLSLALITALFGAMFKVIPDVEVAWRDVWVGALVTALLFVLGKEAIGLYLGSKDVGDAYGTAGSLAMLLLWVYYTSMTVLLGAEITRAWEVRYGAGVRPSRGAVEVVEEKRAVRRG
jgi:membrane protein